MPHATVSKDYRVPIPEEIRQAVPLQPGQSVTIEARRGVITMVPDRPGGENDLSTSPDAGLGALERPLQAPPLEELAAAQGVGPVTSFDALCGGWPEEDLDDHFETAVRRWRDEESGQAG